MPESDTLHDLVDHLSRVSRQTAQTWHAASRVSLQAADIAHRTRDDDNRTANRILDLTAIIQRVGSVLLNSAIELDNWQADNEQLPAS